MCNSMCNNEDYKKCMKCGKFQIDSTIGNIDAPTENIITCAFGGVKKWIWTHTDNGMEFVLKNNIV